MLKKCPKNPPSPPDDGKRINISKTVLASFPVASPFKWKREQHGP